MKGLQAQLFRRSWARGHFFFWGAHTAGAHRPAAPGTWGRDITEVKK